MCGSNPELRPEVNSAKCMAGTTLGFAIVTIVGFGVWPAGPISALAGILSTIGNSIICCCGPKTKSEGSGKMMAGMVINIIACVFHFISIILIIALTIAVGTSTSDRAAAAAAGFILIIASGTIVFALIAGILEAVAAAKMSAARAAILKDGPSTATV